MRAETKATAISPSVKWAVWYRDNGECVLCGRPVDVYHANAHIVRRSQGGKGVEQNIVTLCDLHHRETDEGKNAKENMREIIKYISDLYPGWSREKVTYHKGGTT